jgi:hypothetical protein
MARAGPLGALQLLADALEHQHVGVDRHADGQHDAGDARQVSVAPSAESTPIDQRDVDQQREVANSPNRP